MMLRRLAKDSVVYGVGGLFGKGLAVLLLPLYTRLFTPGEFGAIELVVVVMALLESLLACGLDSAQSYFFFRADSDQPENRAAVVSTVLGVRMSITAALLPFACLLSYLWAPAGVAEAMGDRWLVGAYVCAAVSQLAAQSAETFRLQFMPWRYIIVNVSSAITAACVTFALAHFFRLGPRSYLIGALSGALLSATLGWWSARRLFRPRQMSIARAKEYVRFGLPLLPASLLIYLIYNLDRWLVSHFLGSEALGVYAVGARCAVVVVGAVSTFRLAWWPFAMEAIGQSDGAAKVGLVSAVYVTVAIAGVIILAGLAPWIVRLLAARPFAAATPLVSILSLGSVAYGFLMVGSMGLWRAGRTMLNLPIMLVALLVNGSLGWFLVPRLGLVGGAIAMATALIAAAVASTGISERLWRVHRSFVVVWSQLTLGVAAVGVVLVLQSRGWEVTAGVGSLVVAIVIIGIGLNSIPPAPAGLTADRLP
jgi:O-antigen/teichoic acid export membrane protein